MGSEEIGHRVFQQRNCSSNLNCPSSVMPTDSISDNVARMSMDPFYSTSGWDPIISGNQTGNYLGNSTSMVHQNEFANPNYTAFLENHSMGISSSHLVHFPSNSSFGSGNLSEMVSTFGRIDEPACHEHRQNSEDGALGTSLNGKRKRKNVGVEQQKDQTRTSSESHEEDEKKNTDVNSRGKQVVKQDKDNSNGSEPSKENYILVRAKRGQATNSHSLAERVRRERISERMRLLQELVPGCNKITGKAVMLDEIINYVQSLQQQVEFLSMKLATVNPELNVDIDRILSKDLLHPQGSNATELASHAFPGLPQGTINGFPSTAQPFHPLPPNLWNSELQGLLQMGFDSGHSVSNFDANGLSKMEL